MPLQRLPTVTYLPPSLWTEAVCPFALAHTRAFVPWRGRATARRGRLQSGRCRRASGWRIIRAPCRASHSGPAARACSDSAPWGYARNVCNASWWRVVVAAGRRPHRARPMWWVALAGSVTCLHMPLHASGGWHSLASRASGEARTCLAALAGVDGRRERQRRHRQCRARER